MKFAVANQFFAIADQAGVDYTNVLRAVREDYPRAADLPGPGLRRRPVPVQGHDAAGGLHRRTTSRSARPRCRSTRACPPTSSARSSAATAACAAGRSASSGWRSRPSRTTSARRSSFKLRKLLEWAGAQVLCADPYVDDERLHPARRGARRQRDPRHRRAAPRLPLARPVRPRGRRHLERDRRRDPAVAREGPRHRRGRVHLRLPRRGAARRRPRGRRPRQLQQVRPGDEVVRRPPALPPRRGRREGRRR